MKYTALISAIALLAVFGALQHVPTATGQESDTPTSTVEKRERTVTDKNLGTVKATHYKNSGQGTTTEKVVLGEEYTDPDGDTLKQTVYDGTLTDLDDELADIKAEIRNLKARQQKLKNTRARMVAEIER